MTDCHIVLSVDSLDVNAATRGYDRLQSETYHDGASSSEAQELINKEIMTPLAVFCNRLQKKLRRKTVMLNYHVFKSRKK